MSDSPITVARRLHAALENGLSGEDLRPLVTDDVTVLEHPNLIKPAGSTITAEALMANSATGARLLSKQTYAVRSAIEHDDMAILRLTWTGVIGRDVGGFKEGQVLTAHIAQFIRTRDDRVASIETFDCYEPFLRE